MGFVETIKTCISKSFTCKGRATRSEFWFFWLFQISLYLIAIIFSVISSGLKERFAPSSAILAFLCVVFMLLFIASIPAGFCVSIRRLHDTGKAGVFCLLYLIPFAGIWIWLVFNCMPSEKDNEYGANPFNTVENTDEVPKNEVQQQIMPPPPPVTGANYFVLINNDKLGPLNIQEVRKMFQEGKINRQTWIWKQGMQDWDRMENISELFPD